MAVKRIIAALPFLAAMGLAALLLPIQAAELPVTETTEMVEIMRQVASGEIEREAEKEAGQFALVSAGENCLMRHRGLLSGIDRRVRQQFAAVRLVEGPQASELRQTLLANVEGLAAWRLYLQEADMRLRSGHIDDAMVWFDRAATVEGVPEVCGSDVSLGLSRIAAAKGDRATAFALVTEATVLDPGHFNAHFERALIAVERIARDPEACVTAVDGLVQSTIRMEALLEASSQLFRLKERLAQLELPERAKLFLEGFTEERAGQGDLAGAAYAQGLLEYAQAPAAPCRLEMVIAMQMSLDRIGFEQEG
jgi:hypothetical protein